MLITDALRLHAATTPDTVCIASLEATITYSQMLDLVNMAAHALLRSERSKSRAEQHQVAILTDSSLRLLQVFLAAAKIGWITSVLDPKWTTVNVLHALTEANPDVLLIQDVYLDRVTDLPPEIQVVVIPTQDGVSSATPTYTQWIHGSSAAEPPTSATENDPFYLGYTSGTTGKPKGFLRTHRSWVASFWRSNKAFAVGAGDVVMAPGPLAHSLSLYAAAATLFAGATFYLVRRFDAALVLSLIDSHPVSHIYLVPTMFEALFQQHTQMPERQPGQSLRYIISTGDKWNALSKQRVHGVFPTASLFEFYGASELSFVSILDPEGNRRKPESVGVPVEGVRISLRDALGNEVAQGETGKLYVHSDMLFAGYYRNPVETAHVLQDGWATVGDLARQDDEGFLYIMGRKNNMLISGGLNVYPEEVERVLLQLTEIEEAIVVSLPDCYWGDKIIALIKTQPGSTLQQDNILEHCRVHLAAYKCPKEIRRVRSFPYTHSGKISRAMVQQQLLAGTVSYA